MTFEQTTTGWLITCHRDGCTWEQHHRFLNAATAAHHRHQADHARKDQRP